MTDPTHEPVGSLGEEATRLLGALGDWAQEHAGDEVDGTTTGAAACTWCPLCRAVHLVRGTSPEVGAHLAAAATSLLQAVSALTASWPAHGDRHGDHEGDPSSPPAAGFERIDLDDDDE